MNFLLHHHLATRDLGAPAASVGAMLPDLWRMADRRVFAREVDGAGENATVREVLAGIDHHVEIDRWFHAAPVFKSGERATFDALRACGQGLGAGELFVRMGRLLDEGFLAYPRLARFALAEPPRVRALMGALGESRGEDAASLALLFLSLNPVTRYRVAGVRSLLPAASRWRIL